MNSGVKNVVVFLVNICVCFPLGSGDPRLGVYLCSASLDPARVVAPTHSSKSSSCEGGHFQ